jgi:hypothetical protein
MSIFTWIQANLPLLWLILAILLLGGLAWLIVMQVRLSRLRRRYSLLMQGVEGRNIEQVLDGYLTQALATRRQVEQLAGGVEQLRQVTQLSLQHIGVIRFDAFDDVGGRQSFAAALTDGVGDGVVLSSLAARQATRFYAKPLRRWEAEYTLTEEEKQAIAQARLPRV